MASVVIACMMTLWLATKRANRRRASTIDPFSPPCCTGIANGQAGCTSQPCKPSRIWASTAPLHSQHPARAACRPAQSPAHPARAEEGRSTRSMQAGPIPSTQSMRRGRPQHAQHDSIATKAGRTVAGGLRHRHRPLPPPPLPRCASVTRARRRGVAGAGERRRTRRPRSWRDSREPDVRLQSSRLETGNAGLRRGG